MRHLFLLVGSLLSGARFSATLRVHAQKALSPGLSARTPRGSHRTSRPTTSGDASSMPAGAEMEVARANRAVPPRVILDKLYNYAILTGWVQVLGTEERTPMRRKRDCAHQRTITITSTGLGGTLVPKGSTGTNATRKYRSPKRQKQQKGRRERKRERR